MNKEIEEGLEGFAHYYGLKEYGLIVVNDHNEIEIIGTDKVVEWVNGTDNDKRIVKDVITWCKEHEEMKTK